MSALILIFFAAGFASLSNLCFCKNNESSTKFSGYLFCFYLLSLFLSFLINPTIWHVPFNSWMFGIGALVGIANVGLMTLTAKALRHGPAGLTFVFQNVSSVFPGILLFLLFGAGFGFIFTYTKALGLLLITGSLFLGTKMKSDENPLSLKWLFFALSCLTVQIIALSLIQWRCLLFCTDQPDHFLIPFHLSSESDVWFMPGQFGAAFLVQTLMFLKEKRSFFKPEILYGCLAGIANGSATCLLLLGTKLALPNESSILFPCFAAITIILCNLWAKQLYRENFNLPANALCSAGIFLAAV